MLNGPFSPWPSYTEEEANAVRELLMSNKVNYWTGDHCRRFEESFAKMVGVEHAVAVANGSLALDLALKALDVGPGDEVIVTCRSFVASASSIALTGATVVFADVDHNSQNITLDTVLPFVNKRTKGIVCVHLAGWPCEMEDFVEFGNQNKLFIIEDCAQAHGARLNGRSVGSFGDIGCWSFCQDKIMTTGGEGGMVTTNSRELWEKMWSYKDHGKSWKAMYDEDHNPGYAYVHTSLGTNWRMCEFQGLLGRMQLDRLHEWHLQRSKNAKVIFDNATQSNSYRVPIPSSGIEHAFYKAYIFVRPEALAWNWSRDRVMREIIDRGVPCFTGVCPEIYLEECFANSSKRLPIAHELGKTSLMFLVHPTLTEQEVQLTASVIRDVGEAAAR